MRTQRLFVVLLASIVGMLLFSGVASAGNCCDCAEGCTPGESCTCVEVNTEQECLDLKGVWVGDDNCVTGEPCPNPPYACTATCWCTPEITTIALLSMGLLGIAGYLGLGRRKSKKKE